MTEVRCPECHLPQQAEATESGEFRLPEHEDYAGDRCSLSGKTVVEPAE